MEKTNEIQLQIRKFRVELMREMPFYGDVLSHFDIIESSRVPAACTNGKIILYNPRYFEKLSKGEQNYVIMHELMHILLMHPYRAFGKDEIVWNVASDIVVNALLDNLLDQYDEVSTFLQKTHIPFKKPKGLLCFGDYSGESVEQLYQKIYEVNKEIIEKVKHLTLEICERNGDKFKIKIDEKNLDLILNLSKEEMECLEGRVRQWCNEAMERWSNDPSVEIIRQQLFILDEPKILPWKKILRNFLTETEPLEVSYDHPERKYLHMDMILPGEGIEYENNNLSDVWAFIDTSGSISLDVKNEFITQLYRICKQFDTKVNIGFWDVKMHEIYKNVSKNDLADVSSAYIGGTDANAVYDYLDANKPNASVILILTDGYFNRVEERRIKPYRKKTIVVLSAHGYYYCSEMGKLAML